MKRTAWLKLAAISALVAGCWGDGTVVAPTDAIAILGEGGTSFSSAAMEAELEVLKVGIDTSDGTLRLPVTETPAAAVESTFPYIWVANSGEDTISKIDVRTGVELGVYRTRPDSGAGGNPSRTTVDQDGNVWVGNRGSNTVVKVGLKEYGQCVDRNNNGVIDSSTGRSDIKGWTGTAVVTAQDECILQYVALSAPGVTTPSDIRTVAIDPQNNVFIGGNNQNSLFKINGSTGAIITATSALQSFYGGVVDKQGNLWSMSSGSGKVQKTSADLSSSTLIDLGHSGYGIALDNAGRVWTTEYGTRFSVFDPADPVGTLKVFSQAEDKCCAQGIATDDNGDVFIAGSLSSNHVGHYRPTIVGGSVTAVTFIANYTVGSAPTGVAVDGLGKVWSTNVNTNNVSRITLAAGTATAVVDNFPVGAGPYNYSDMTGRVVRTVTNRQGTWIAVFDGKKAGFDWSGIIWTLGNMPSGTTVEVSYRVVDAENRGAAQVQFGSVAYTTATSGTALANAKGRFIQIRVRLTSDSTSKTPVVKGLTVR